MTCDIRNCIYCAFSSLVSIKIVTQESVTCAIFIQVCVTVRFKLMHLISATLNLILVPMRIF